MIEDARERQTEMILASSSPRRKELLRQIGVHFRVIPPEIEEESLPGESPDQLVSRLSCEKAGVVADRNPDALVLGSDTVVVHKEKILGKPRSVSEARSMLLSLSGNTHTVYSGFAFFSARTIR